MSIHAVLKNVQAGKFCRPPSYNRRETSVGGVDAHENSDRTQGAAQAMSKPEKATAAPEGEDGAVAEAPKKGGKKKLIIIAAAAAVLLGGGGGGAYFMLGTASANSHGAEEAPAEAAPSGHGEGGEGAETALVDVPAMVVNLRTAGGDQRYLKIHFMLVPKTASAGEAVKGKLPAIIDAYQPFLRELRPEDLAGAAAVFRIKEELLTRASDVMGAGKVEDVLIQDLVQQ
jgi:flagellar FliL protein